MFKEKDRSKYKICGHRGITVVKCIDISPNVRLIAVAHCTNIDCYKIPVTEESSGIHERPGLPHASVVISGHAVMYLTSHFVFLTFKMLLRN